MRTTVTLYRKVRVPKREIGKRHSQPYPNLPWLTASKPNFMDHAQHVYGPLDTWDEMIRNPDSPTQHYPLQLVTDAILSLENKLKRTKHRNAQFAERAQEADECAKKWFQEMMQNGVRCLENFHSPQRAPGDTRPIRSKAHQKAIDDQFRELDGRPEHIPGNEAMSMPFLRQRAEEDPSSLHPSLADWTKKHQPGAETIEVLPVGKDQAPGEPKPNASPGAENTKPQKEKPERLPRERRGTPRTLKEYRKKNPIFDAQHTFEQKQGKAFAKVDWETLRGAATLKGYDRKRALERKIRLKRGEDV